MELMLPNCLLMATVFKHFTTIPHYRIYISDIRYQEDIYVELGLLLIIITFGKLLDIRYLPFDLICLKPMHK